MDYGSRENDFLHWAHIYWPFIHKAAAMAVTPDKRIAYRKLMSSEVMYHLIPCDHPCAPSFLRHLKEYPIDQWMESNDTLLEWSIVLHNVVNDETGKPRLSDAEVDQIKRWYLPVSPLSDNGECNLCSSDPGPSPASYREGIYKLNPTLSKVVPKTAFRHK